MGTFAFAASSFNMTDSQQSRPSDFELMLARAFDSAWEDFLKIEGVAEDTAENRGSLAARIVVLGKFGEADENTISAGALLFLRALSAARRLSIPRATTSRDLDNGGAALNPEVVDLATGTLETCLAELPEGISSQARSILAQSILENTRKGERDGDRLRALALNALKSR